MANLHDYFDLSTGIPKQAGMATQERSAKMKILIIDDEPINVALLEDMLSEAGYKQLRS